MIGFGRPGFVAVFVDFCVGHLNNCIADCEEETT